MSGFADPIIGGAEKLIRKAIQSPNYSPGAAGWTINKDGSAEFNNLNIRGTFAGTDFIINGDGEFFYSPSEGPGNLAMSNAPAAGTDAFGNQYLAGVVSYGSIFASQLGSGFVTMYHGSQAGGWTEGGTIETDSSLDLILLAVGKVLTGNNTLDDGAGNMTVSGSLSVNGSTSTANAGLTDGTINGTSGQSGLPNGGTTGTSGGASAGTAHTHGPGSYSVSNGQHTHAPGSFAVTNGTHKHVL